MPNIAVKIKAGTEKQTISQIPKTFQAYNKGVPFDYQFLDENYKALYAAEMRVGVLSKYFAGLAAFTAQRRRKEIGIRKVIGASVSNIVVMLSKDFLKLILVAVFIAFPVAWWATSYWLNGFAYRIHVGVSIFLIAGFCIICITLFTISFQAIKAAIANPVNSLRAE
jgi:putative ABC transport system permease protein